MNTPELTVILTAHNRADLVEESLAALAEQEWDSDWEIVLVDNASRDATPQILERWADKMPVPTHVVTAAARHNLSYARAAGVAASTATSVAFLDDDDVIDAGYVAAVGTALRTEQLVGPRHEHHRYNSDAVASFRGAHQSIRLGTVFGVPMVSGGGFSCRRSLWDELGGQTEAFEYGGEDSDFSLRAHALGVTGALVDDAVYHVRHRRGLAASFHQGRRLSLARVRLYRLRGADFGARPDRLPTVLRAWGGLVLRLATLRTEGGRLTWAWQLGRRVGRLQGSIAERTWYP